MHLVLYSFFWHISFIYFLSLFFVAFFGFNRINSTRTDAPSGRKTVAAGGGLLVGSLSILVASGRKEVVMVTTMDDPCPNGAQEEEEEMKPTGQPAVKSPPTVQSSQGTDGGEEMRAK